MSSSRFMQWAKLVRLPNTPTVIADILAGFVMASGNWQPSINLVLGICAIIAFYWCGMLWNDVADLEQDSRERPHRPLPSQTIGLGAAKFAGIALILTGLAFAYLLDFHHHHASSFYLICTVVSILLVMCILLYDIALKRTWAAPWLMGSCRSLSLLLGCTAGGFAFQHTDAWLPTQAIMAAVIGHGIYVAGFTLAGRKEASTSTNRDLTLGWAISLIGIALLASVDAIAVHFGIDPSHRRVDKLAVYPVLILLLALPLFRHAWQTLRTHAGRDIQRSIKQAILTIIFFDAAIALQFGSSLQAIIICAMIIPMLVLGRWFYST